VIPVSFVVPAAVLALAFLAWVLLRLIRLSRRGEGPQAALLAWRAGVLWVVGLLLATLGGRPRDPSGSVFFNWVPFGAQSAVSRPEIVLNLLLFAPAGLLLPWILLRVGRWRLVLVSVGCAFLLSSLIEIAQAFTPLGTAGDLTDILLNTTGCALAAVVAVVAGKLSEVVGRKKYEVRSDSAGRVGG
jgi:glycopeptide antibiotics resistance protein